MKETKFCVKCGAKLLKTNLDAWWCPNCGKLLDNQDKPSNLEDGDIFYV